MALNCISDAILVILGENKIGIFPREIFTSDEEIIPFERYIAP